MRGQRGKSLTVGLVLLLTALAVGCAGAATVNPTPAPTRSGSAAPDAGMATATPMPVSPVSSSPKVGKDLITLVIPEEPSVMNIFASSSTEEASLMRYTMNDALVRYDRQTLELVPTSGVTGWQQEAPDRWRLFLRQGVKFHNGEPWDAEAAAYSLNIIGQSESAATSYNYTGEISASAVDEFTVDILCAIACPIMDRSLAWTAFQAPKWHSTSSPEALSGMTIAFGPYKQAEYSRGQSVRLEVYEDYVPVPGVAEMQKASIKEQLYLSGEWKTSLEPPW
jgi:peptide/nickel transport system substrate-binding protein